MQAAEVEAKQKRRPGIPDEALIHAMKEAGGSCRWQLTEGSGCKRETVLTFKNGTVIKAPDNTRAIIKMAELLGEI